MNISDLLSLSPQQFEIAVSRLLARMGYQTELTKYTGDGGIDIFARSSQPVIGAKLIVQCKRYAPQVTVGEPVLRDLYGLVISSGANKGLIVTTSSFTPAAVQFAQGKPLELIEGQILTSLMRDDPSAQNIMRSFELDETTVCDSNALVENILEWCKTVPKPFPLRLTTEFGIWWEEYWERSCFRQVFGVDRSMAHLLFRLDFIAAMFSLVCDATFRDRTPDADDLRPKLTTELNPTCTLVQNIIAEKPRQTKIEIEEYLSTGTTNERRTQALELAQSDIQHLCVRFWWKRHKEAFLAADMRCTFNE